MVVYFDIKYGSFMGEAKKEPRARKRARALLEMSKSCLKTGHGFRFSFRGGARLSHSALPEQYKPTEGQRGVSAKAKAPI
jgi:hypothetical protein